MVRRLLLFIIGALALISCSGGKNEPEAPKVDTIPMLVTQVQRCSKLYTAECHVHKIITHSDVMKLRGTVLRQDFDFDMPFGERKIAIPMDATIKGYIDLSTFSEKNVKRNGDKIEIILPDPSFVMTSSRIDHEGIKRHVDLARGNFSDAELASYEKQGRDAIIADIPKMGITAMAMESAARNLIPMLTAMGYKESDITISFRKDFSQQELVRMVENIND